MRQGHTFVHCGSLTAVSLSLEHQCTLGSLQVIHHHVSTVEGRHHVGGVTTVEVHWCGNPMFCTQTHKRYCFFHLAVPLCLPLCLTRLLRLTSVCVESADAGVFLRWVPQFDCSVCWAGQEEILDATVGQSPNGICVLHPRASEDAGIWLDRWTWSLKSSPDYVTQSLSSSFWKTAVCTVGVVGVYVWAGDVPPLDGGVDASTETLLTTRGHRQR